jgi:hypothetical protein
MRLFNKGQRTIQHAESDKPGGKATPGAFFTVTDALGHTLKKAYRHELQNLDDVTEGFVDKPSSGGLKPAQAQPAAASVASPSADGSPAAGAAPQDDDFLDPPATVEESEEAKSYGVKVWELRESKAKAAAAKE